MVYKRKINADNPKRCVITLQNLLVDTTHLPYISDKCRTSSSNFHSAHKAAAVGTTASTIPLGKHPRLACSSTINTRSSGFRFCEVPNHFR